jgi:UDP-N-acetylmuramate: L-alanyl-gamma-D-glutamyl-meso-diaminopimelate ligase
MSKRVHIIGIVGQLSAPLAVALKKKGWQVTGSDQEKTFPPLTDYLLNNGISWSAGYNENNINSDIDLIIIAGSALRSDPKNPEVKKSLLIGLETISQAQAIERFIIKKNSVVIAGTYGKTTTTAMMVAIFKHAVKLSYMIGGVPIEKISPLRIGQSDWSVVEGDEYPTLGFNPNSKFLYYQPKFLILTAARWEHQDVFKSEKDYIQTFQKLVAKIPKDGFVLASRKGKNLEKVLKNYKGEVFWYGIKKSLGADFWAEEITPSKEKQVFYLHGKTINKPIKIETRLFGKHNIENAIAASSMAFLCNLPEKYISKGLKQFSGIKKRMETVGTFNGITIISDLSQTKPRIKAALKAVKERFSSDLWVVFYPHYSGLQEKQGLHDLQNAFNDAKMVLVTKVIFRTDISKKNRVTGNDIAKTIDPKLIKAKYMPIDEKVVELISKKAKSGDVVIFMSSGDYRNIQRQTINILKRRER